MGVAACSPSDGGVVGADEADGASLARSRFVLADAGESAESVRACCFGGEGLMLCREPRLGDDVLFPGCVVGAVGSL